MLPLTKINSLGPNHQLLIALHSPNALLKTGLRICLPEKSQDSDPSCCRAVHSLQSGLWTKYCELRAFFAYFGERAAEFPLQLRLAGGGK